MENDNKLLSEALSAMSDKLTINYDNYKVTDFFTKKENCVNKELIKQFLYSFLDEKTFDQLNDYIYKQKNPVWLGINDPYMGFVYKHIGVHINTYSIISQDHYYINPDLLTLYDRCKEDGEDVSSSDKV